MHRAICNVNVQTKEFLDAHTPKGRGGVGGATKTPKCGGKGVEKQALITDAETRRFLQWMKTVFVLAAHLKI